MTERPPTDPIQLWQGQKTEGIKMSLEDVRTKARNLENYRRSVGWITLPLSAIFTLFYAGIVVRHAFQKGVPFTLSMMTVLALGLGINLVWISVSFIRTRTTPPDAGLKTSVEAYRAHFEMERTMFPRTFGALAVLMLAATFFAASLWMRASVFPTWDAIEFLFGDALLGVMIYIAHRHIRNKRERGFRMLDALESDDRS